MKFFLASLLLFSFVGVAIFGFLALASGNEHGFGDCLAVAANGMACPYDEQSLGFVSFHLNALKKFSTAVFIDPLILAFAFALVLAVVLSFSFSVFITSFSSGIRGIFYYSFSSPGRHTFIRWLALHENSPSFSS